MKSLAAFSGRLQLHWRLWLALIGVLAVIGIAMPAHADYSDHPAAQKLADKLADKGMEQEHVMTLLRDAQRKDSILEAIARPAEQELDWGEYQDLFLQSERIEQGRQFWKQHRALFQRAQREYHVSPYIILAILGVETRYGRQTGHYRVLDALATLAFDYPPRADFFRDELRAFLQLEQEAGIDASQLKGSYAGAMGYPQFMPSSYHAYAVDFDDDGKTDLVHSVADAIGSVANYLSEHGWRSELPVTARARVSGDAYQDLFGQQLKPSMTLQQLGSNNVTPLSCHSQDLPSPHCFDLPPETRVTPLRLQGSYGSEFWLGTRNFYVISRYNHSRLYSMAVYQLARRIETSLQEADS